MAKQSKILPSHVLKGIEKSIQQMKEGKIISLDELKKGIFPGNNSIIRLSKLSSHVLSYKIRSL